MPSKKKSEKLIAKQYPESPSFEMFWAAYPRKAGKQKARGSWEALDPSDALVEKMIRAIGRQQESQQWRDPGLIPHPTTWLNQHRWEDEMAPANPLTKQGAETMANLADWLDGHKGGIDAARLASGPPSGSDCTQ